MEAFGKFSSVLLLLCFSARVKEKQFNQFIFKKNKLCHLQPDKEECGIC